MDELENLENYDGDEVHDMWVDYTNHEYTGDLEEYFDDEEIDEDYDDVDDEY